MSHRIDRVKATLKNCTVFDGVYFYFLSLSLSFCSVLTLAYLANLAGLLL